MRTDAHGYPVIVQPLSDDFSFQVGHGSGITQVLLPDGTNVNYTLVKEGWCGWYRKYVPGDTHAR